MNLLFDFKFLTYYVVLLIGTYLIMLGSNSDWTHLPWVHFVTWFVVFLGASITYSFWRLNQRLKQLEISYVLLTLFLQNIQKQGVTHEQGKVGSDQQEDQ